MWYLIEGVVVGVVCYLVGSNNPLPSVRAKIQKAAQDALTNAAKKV
jgi:hypothetical protein